jgi:DNA mismatch repair protein MutS
MSKLSPMMRQYQEIKDKYSDCILFFRLGDFYEMFNEDAEKGAKILGIALTQRHGTPMCGIPHHAAENYLAKITAAGEKVALCEQVSDPSLPGIVKRDVVRVVTPGTTFSEHLLDQKSNSYVMSIFPKRDYFGLATIDLTTGTFLVTEVTGYDQLTTELQRLQPRECLLPQDINDPNLESLLGAFESLHTYTYSTAHDAYQTLQKQFNVNSLEAFGIQKWPFAIQAAGLLLNYLKDTQKTALDHLKSLTPYSPGDHMLLDEATLRNLELTTTLRDQKKEGSLLGVLDHTQTAMGGRLLKHWVLRPLTSLARIQPRLDGVATFYSDPMLAETLREGIGKILDLERVLSRLTLDRGNPRDLIALKVSLQKIPMLKQYIPGGELLDQLNEQLQPLPELIGFIDSAICDEPPINLREGGFIKEGFHAELDELRGLSREGKGFIKVLQEREIKRTGINSLKVKYNRVFGYYIEISKSNLANVPDDYIRKQTLVNAERYITPELKEYEEKVLTADEKSKALENELFREVRTLVMEDMRAIQRDAEAIAILDVLLSFAHVAAKNRYAKPTLIESGPLDISEGRHPVVESMNVAGDFVPNDIVLGAPAQKIILLTGPNMSGKSTILRQTALITLLAHIGSYVPAKAATIPMTDRIFTRVGASDNLVRGQSTFMVEMEEAANILNNATDRSLIILDEIGRGTSTYDGVSIAWGILEYLHDTVGAKTLFATHYHELIAVTDRLARARNFCVAVEEDGQRGVVFLHKILEGGIDKSYGIEVAKLAGLPQEVIQRAQHILDDLEEGVVEKGIRDELAHTPNNDQIGLFEAAPGSVPESTLMERDHGKVTHPALERLKQLDTDRMTPIEALHALDELKKESS